MKKSKKKSKKKTKNSNNGRLLQHLLLYNRVDNPILRRM
jgi:hypothetical protein